MTVPNIKRPALLDPINGTTWPARTSVAIVGGGPVGLSAAIMLAQRGIDVMLCERRGFESRFPRAHLLNVRTMEAFDAMGVADDIYAAGPQDDRWHKVVWYTSVAGDTPADGVRIGEVAAWGGGADAVRYASASPCKFANLPQLRLDPLLYAHAAAACPGRIRGNMEVIDLVQYDDGVDVTVFNHASDTTQSIRADYVILADGGRSSEDLLGIQMEGPRNLREVVNYHVRTDLSMWAEPDALLGFFFHPRGGLRRMGTIQALGPNSYDRNSDEWLVAVSGWMLESGDIDAVQAIRAMLALPDNHAVELITESRWVYNAIIANRWRTGRVFIAGDAAHKHPPTGGLGLNSGVQDVENLVWKLAAVLHGDAPDSLLDSYEIERRPTTAFYTAHSLLNAARHAPIAEALRLSSDEEASRRSVALFLSDTPEGDEIRRDVARAVQENSNDYSQLNVEAGFFYRAGALVPDGSPVPSESDSPTAFAPTTRPGSHLPHAWLTHSHGGSVEHPVSTRSLVQRTGLTLLIGEAAAEAWTDALGALNTGLPVTLVVIPDAEAAWSEVREIGADGAVLVRPDAKNAWRLPHLPNDPATALQEAVALISRGGDRPGTDLAAPSFELIRQATAMLTA